MYKKHKLLHQTHLEFGSQLFYLPALPRPTSQVCSLCHSLICLRGKYQVPRKVAVIENVELHMLLYFMVAGE